MVIAMLCLAGTTVSLQQTMVVPLRPVRAAAAPPGHNILTVLDRNTLQTQATKIFTTTQSAVADIELSAPSRERDLLPR